MSLGDERVDERVLASRESSSWNRLTEELQMLDSLRQSFPGLSNLSMETEIGT